MPMIHRRSMRTLVVLAALTAIIAGASAHDDSKYPDWKGQWMRAGSGQGAPWDPSKPGGLAQQAPLTRVYQAIYEANLRDQAAGGQGTDPSYLCIPAGMPRIMIAVQPMEIVVTPDTTYVMLELFSTLRRIYTDGRDFPKEFEPSFTGYSIGKWEDADGDGRFDTLVVETRGVKGPHTYDSSGVPFHEDGEAVIRERIYSDKTNPASLKNEITVTDHALTRPWTVTRSYRRIDAKHPNWTEYVCSENNHHVQIGKENYMVSGDGFLMPVRKDQPPPNLKYFAAPGK
jgi:hypothetical protein